MDRRNILKTGLAASFMGHSKMSFAKVGGGHVVLPEEHKHERTFMQWPVSSEVYPDPYFLKMVQQTIADIANHVGAFEPVVMLVAKEHHLSAGRLLTENVRLWDVPTEDLWCRDSGPIFVMDGAGGLAIRHIQFNGWGGKQVHKNDGLVAERVAQILSVPLLSSALHGEAGGVEQDGHGLLMAHESSWVNNNRNPSMTRDEVEAALLLAYGADRMIWSAGVWGEDITDYHIDSLVRFTGPARALINLPENPDMRDPFHVAALDTHDAMLRAGIELDVIFEPNKRRVDDIEFVASYANYYVCNGAVIAAEFGDPEMDQIAVEALKRHYPGREILTLNVDALGEIGGGIHCATHEMPAV